MIAEALVLRDTELAEKLRSLGSLRKKADVPLNDLADRLGMKSTQLSNYEAGSRGSRGFNLSDGGTIDFFEFRKRYLMSMRDYAEKRLEKDRAALYEVNRVIFEELGDE